MASAFPQAISPAAPGDAPSTPQGPPRQWESQSPYPAHNFCGQSASITKQYQHCPAELLASNPLTICRMSL